MMTTSEAAKLLKVDTSRIRQVCISGELKATKHGRDWWIEPEDLESFAAKPRLRGWKAGRPRKQKGAK